MFTAESEGRVRVVPILLACVGGFLLGEIVAMVLVMVVSQIVHFSGGYQAIAQSSAPPWWSNALGLVGLWVGFGSAIYYATAHGHLATLVRQWRLQASDALYVMLGVGCQIGIDVAYRPFHFKNVNGPVTHLFGAAHGPTFVVLMIMTTFVAPIVEEWFFRGVVFRSLDEGIRGVSPRFATTAAVVISATLFGLAHGEPLQFVGLALFGVVLAIVLHRTQRLVPSIITHMSFNAVAMVGLIAQRSGH